MAATAIGAIGAGKHHFALLLMCVTRANNFPRPVVRFKWFVVFNPLFSHVIKHVFKRLLKHQPNHLSPPVCMPTKSHSSSPIISMTGFASVSGEVPGGRFALDLKSVNHRYLEFQTRMPEDLRALESVMREQVAAKLTRGKVDCRITFTPVASRDTLTPNDAALGALAELQKSILQKFEARPLSVSRSNSLPAERVAAARTWLRPSASCVVASQS